MKIARDEKAECDHCGKHTLEIEQQSCVTSHVEEEMFPFLKHTCFKDQFYCLSCIDEFGFCDKCSEEVSTEDQKKIFNHLNRFNKL